MRRARTVALALATLAASGVALVAIAKPQASQNFAPPWADPGGLRPASTACLGIERDLRDGGVERICLTDEELGGMVRRMGAVCTDQAWQTQLSLGIDDVKEERRLHGTPKGGR